MPERIDQEIYVSPSRKARTRQRHLLMLPCRNPLPEPLDKSRLARSAESSTRPSLPPALFSVIGSVAFANGRGSVVQITSAAESDSRSK